MLNQDHKSWIDRLCGGVHLFVHFSQVGMYHDPHVEDGATAGDSRMIFTESMPRRVGSFYRGEGLETVCIDWQMHEKDSRSWNLQHLAARQSQKWCKFITYSFKYCIKALYHKKNLSNLGKTLFYLTRLCVDYLNKCFEKVHVKKQLSMTFHDWRGRNQVDLMKGFKCIDNHWASSLLLVPSPRPDNSSSFHDGVGQSRGPVSVGPVDPVAMVNHSKRQTAFDWCDVLVFFFILPFGFTLHVNGDTFPLSFLFFLASFLYQDHLQQQTVEWSFDMFFPTDA